MSFKNVEELRELIKLGWSNEEIIKSRLAYLNSEEYKKNRLETKYYENSR